MTTSPAQLTPAALEALLHDGTLAGSWSLDAARSQVRLKSRSLWGLVPIKGAFREVTGSGEVTAAGDATGVITVAAGSIDTKNSKRDEHLRSADFLDAARHPDITFTAHAVRPAGAGVKATGSLTIRGRTRPVSFDARASVLDAEVRLDGEVQVSRADFGLTWNQMGMASMDNTITIHAVFTRP